MVANRKDQAGNGKGVIDRLLNLMGIQEENASEATAPEVTEPVTPGTNRRGRLVSLPGQKSSMDKLRVVVVEPSDFDEVQEIAGYLKQRRPVIVSLESMPREVAKRVVDFVSGATYALDGDMHRLGEHIFLFTPSNVGIDVTQRLVEFEDTLV